MNNILLAATTMTLSKMNNDVIAAAFNALTGFDKIGSGNLAFKIMKDANLIRDNGQAKDKETLLTALSLEINQRIVFKLDTTKEWEQKCTNT